MSKKNYTVTKLQLRKETQKEQLERIQRREKLVKNYLLLILCMSNKNRDYAKSLDQWEINDEDWNEWIKSIQ